MSLLRAVIRGCAVAALRDQSWAGASVWDSDMTPLTQAVQGTAAAPYIVVYTDADDNQPVPGENEVYNGLNRRLQVCLEIGIASAVRSAGGGAKASSPTLVGGSATTRASGFITFSVNPSPGDSVTINTVQIKFQTTPASGEVGIATDLLGTLSALLSFLKQSTNPLLTVMSYALTSSSTIALVYATVGSGGNNVRLVTSVSSTVIQFSHTDFASELAVDTVCHQALAALIGNPQSRWGELYKRFTMHLLRMPTRRGGQSQGGIRFAARRITLVHNTIWDLMPGVVPEQSHPIWEFIRLANEQPLPGPTAPPSGNVQDMANIIQGLIATTNAPDWRQAQTMLGLTKRGVRHLFAPGTPLPIPGFEEPPLDWSDPDEFVPPFTDLTITGGGGDQPTVITPVGPPQPPPHEPLPFPWRLEIIG